MASLLDSWTTSWCLTRGCHKKFVNRKAALYLFIKDVAALKVNSCNCAWKFPFVCAQAPEFSLLHVVCDSGVFAIKLTANSGQVDWRKSSRCQVHGVEKQCTAVDKLWCIRKRIRFIKIQLFLETPLHVKYELWKCQDEQNAYYFQRCHGLFWSEPTQFWHRQSVKHPLGHQICSLNHNLWREDTSDCYYLHSIL